MLSLLHLWAELPSGPPPPYSEPIRDVQETLQHLSQRYELGFSLVPPFSHLSQSESNL